MKTKEPAWTHGEYQITYAENRAKFVVSLGAEEGLAERDTLADARTYCDGHDKRRNDPKKKFQPIPAYHTRYSGDPEPVTITSFTEKGHAWIKNAKGEREKIGGWRGDLDLFARDAASDIAVAKIEDIEKRREALAAEKDALRKSLKRIKAEAIVQP